MIFTFSLNIVRNDPALAAEYAPKVRKGMSVYRQAILNFLNPTVIHKIDTSGYLGHLGNKITVTAINDFRITSVKVKITDSNGTIIEEGACVLQLPSGNYEYTATQQVKALPGTIILARASDLPGHISEESVLL